MDDCFDILLPKGSKFKEIIEKPKYFFWGGIYHKQPEEKYYYDKNVIFNKIDMPTFYYNLLPNELVQFQWDCYSLDYYTLNLLKNEYNGKEIKWGDKSFKELLYNELSAFNTWVVFYLKHCDDIDNIYNGDVDLIFHKLMLNLKIEIDHHEGFIIWCKR